MSNKNFPLKLKINPWRIILIFVLSFVVLEAIFYSIFQPWYQGDFFPFNKASFYIYTAALMIITVVFAILSISKTYYVIDAHQISHFKMGHEDVYRFVDIIYIDEEWSKKHKMLQFYLKSGKSRTLAFDKDGLLFKYAVEKSYTISKEEFVARFPNIHVS